MAFGIQGFGFNPAQFGVAGTAGFPTAGAPIQQFGGGPVQAAQMMQMLQVVLGAVSALAQQWSGLLGQAQQQFPFQQGPFPGQPTFLPPFGQFPGQPPFLGGPGGFQTGPFPGQPTFLPPFGQFPGQPTFLPPFGQFPGQPTFLPPFGPFPGQPPFLGQPPVFGGGVGGSGTSLPGPGGVGRPGGGYGGGGGGGVGGGGTGGVGSPQVDPRFTNWSRQVVNNNSSTVSNAERNDISDLTDRGRAVLHLWGRQITAQGRQDGSIYFNVLNDQNGAFTPAEKELVRELYQREMQMFGGVTGKLLDQQFFGLMGQMTGEDLSSRYLNTPVNYSNGRPVDLSLQATNNNGLGDFANAVLRLWGHDRLDSGKNDGSILQFTLQNPNIAFDKDLDQNIVRSLLAADAADGGVDGSSLARAFRQTLDQVYLGGPGGSVQSTLGQAGITTQQVGSILDNLKNTPFPGIPPGVDITNIQNIGRCPVFGSSVTQQGIQLR